MRARQQFAMLVVSWLVVWLAVAACVRLPFVPAARRSVDVQASAAVRVERSCFEADPFDALRDHPTGESVDFGMAVGSGVIVSERHVVTAAHVVRCPLLPLVVVVLGDGRRFHAAVTYEDDDADLARLEISSADTFRLGLAPPVIGTVGDPPCAEVAWPTRRRNCGHREPGNSGAGAYNAEGELVGIVTRELGGVVRLSRHLEVMP